MEERCHSTQEFPGSSPVRFVDLHSQFSKIAGTTRVNCNPRISIAPENMKRNFHENKCDAVRVCLPEEVHSSLVRDRVAGFDVVSPVGGALS